MYTQQLIDFFNNKRILYFFIISVSLLYISGMFISPMDIDAAQYAYISMEMEDSGSFLIIKDRFEDYLDKPPLLFWLSAFSYKIFGINAFAYKLPTLLVAFISCFATYKIATLFYNRYVGLLSVGIQLTLFSHVTFLSDVRTDALLSSFCMVAIYGILYYLDRKKWIYFFVGFAGIAGAMLSKGPMGCMLPILALSCHWVHKRRWSYFFRWEWLLGICFVLLLLSPMLYGLYKQFKMKGLEFYFWTQSFGRITGQNTTWRDDTTFFFFMHTFLWAFLPWTFHFLYGLYARGKQCALKQGRFIELLTLGGGLITFFVLSLSQYKLPHYIYAIFPLFSIFTAHSILNLLEQGGIFVRKTLYALGLLISVFTLSFSAWIVFYVFPSVVYGIIYAFLLAAFLGFLCFTWKKFSILQKTFYPILGTYIIFYFILNLHFYPFLIENYQLGTVMARKVVQKDIPKEKIFFLGYTSRAFDFHLKKIYTPRLDLYEVEQKYLAGETFWLSITDQDYVRLQRKNIPFTPEAAKDFFRVTMLTLPFLNPNTRPEVLKKGYIVRVN